jgi:hypothetical protein
MQSGVPLFTNLYSSPNLDLNDGNIFKIVWILENKFFPQDVKVKNERTIFFEYFYNELFQVKRLT